MIEFICAFWREVFNPINNEIVKQFSYTQDLKISFSKLNGSLRKTYLPGSKTPVGTYTDTGFEFKLNYLNLIVFVPKVIVTIDESKQKVRVRQYFEEASKTVQFIMFSLILICGLFFLVGAVIGTILDFVLEGGANVRLSDILLILSVVLLSGLCCKFFTYYRAKIWEESYKTTYILLNRVGFDIES